MGSEYVANIGLALEASARQNSGVESRCDWAMRQWVEEKVAEFRASPSPIPVISAMFRERGVPMHVFRRLILGVA